MTIGAMSASLQKRMALVRKKSLRGKHECLFYCEDYGESMLFNKKSQVLKFEDCILT